MQCIQSLRLDDQEGGRSKHIELTCFSRYVCYPPKLVLKAVACCRFNSKDEILTCNCGAPSCRGTVNFYDDDEGDEFGRILAPVSEIKPWDPTKTMRGV